MEKLTFEQAQEIAKQIGESMTNDEKLQIYGLFKQGTVGDINTNKPGIFDQKGRYKWDAWEKCKGISKEEAGQKYANLVTELKKKYT